MKIEQFDLERGQSLWEHRVELNLSESGVHPVTLQELGNLGLDLERVQSLPLGYVQTNGTPELRRALAGLYPGSTPEHFEVTNGTSEANFLLCHTLIEPGDEILVQLPNYLQVAGLARSFGATVRTFRLCKRPASATDARGWEPDWDELGAGLNERTRFVYVSHPNNPTGFAWTADEMERLVAAVDRVSAWLLADEIYRGAELDGQVSPSFWGLSDRVLVTSGLAKSYGLPGARIGWLAAPPELAERCWLHHDYTTIAPTALGDLIAQFAVRSGVREQLQARARSYMVPNRDLFRNWVASLGGLLEYREPRAGAYAFLEYQGSMPSVELGDRIRERHSVLVVPGTWMGLESHLRISLGTPRPDLEEGLRRIALELDASLTPAVT